MANRFSFSRLVFVWCFTNLAISLACGQSNVSNNTSQSSDGKSNHFEIRTYPNGPSAKSVLQLCEAVRSELQRVWHSDSKCENWEPRCEIVLHPNRASYQSIVAGDFTSYGSSLIKMDAGKVAARRIDLLIDANGALTALPHEMTHVILADLFKGRQPPLWMDEGIAMLADTREKQMLHHRDCLEAIATGRSLPLKELLQLEQFTSAEQVPAFYGQSLSLVRMLSDQSKPHTVIHFALDAMDIGIDKSLQKHFAVQNLGELEKRWKTSVGGGASASPPSTSIVNVRFQP